MSVDHIHKRHPVFLLKHIDREIYSHTCLAVHFDVWTCIKMAGKLLVHHVCFEPRLHGGKTRSGWKPTTELNIQTHSLSLLFSSSLTLALTPAPLAGYRLLCIWSTPPSCPCLATSHHINIQSFDGDAFLGGGPARIIHQAPLMHYAMFLSIQGH